MTKLNELATAVKVQSDRVEKIIVEIQVLKEALENTPIPAEAEAALSRLDALTRQADELNADEPADPEEPTE